MERPELDQTEKEEFQDKVEKEETEDRTDKKMSRKMGRTKQKKQRIKKIK